MKLKEVPSHLRKYVRSTKTRAELSGLSAAEVRQVTSAAVGGCWSAVPDCRSFDPSDYMMGMSDNDRPWQKAARESKQDIGTVLLSSLLTRHWHPLLEADKRAAWEGQGEADLERPPGVRMTIDESSHSANRIAGSWQASEQTAGMAAGNEGIRLITSPSTSLARRLEGQFSKGKIKPAWELCIWARKPISEGTELMNVVRWGVGGVNCAAGMIPFAGSEDTWQGHKVTGKPGGAALYGNQDGTLNNIWMGPNLAGRYPPNLLCQDAALGEEGSRFFSIDSWAQEHGFTDEGWADAAEAGLLQCPKPSRAEKNAGCEGLEATFAVTYQQRCWQCSSCGRKWPNSQGALCECGAQNVRAQVANPPRGNQHATVKSIRLFGYLCALLCPPGGLVLDPFAGSGTTGVAAILDGHRAILIEREPEYCRIAEARCTHAEREAENKRRREQPRLPGTDEPGKFADPQQALAFGEDH